MSGPDLKSLREQAGVTRRELAREISYSTGVIQRIEQEERGMPAEFPALVRQALVTINARRAEETRVLVGAA